MRTDHAVTVEPARGLMHIRLAGFFDLDGVNRIDLARREALGQLDCGPNGHLTLCDISECRLQAQDIVVAFGAILDDRTVASKRIAFVTGRSVARMQIRRLLTRAGMACFATAGEAEAWLFDKAPARSDVA